MNADLPRDALIAPVFADAADCPEVITLILSPTTSSTSLRGAPSTTAPTDAKSRPSSPTVWLFNSTPPAPRMPWRLSGPRLDPPVQFYLPRGIQATPFTTSIKSRRTGTRWNSFESMGCVLEPRSGSRTTQVPTTLPGTRRPCFPPAGPSSITTSMTTRPRSGTLTLESGLISLRSICQE